MNPEAAPPLPKAALGLLAASFVALTLPALARPNATQPDLRSGLALPIELSPWGVTLLLWGGYLVGAVALAWLWRARGGLAIPRVLPLVLAAVALLGAPTGSGDHLNYAAYGRIVVQGGDPYTQSPIAWHGGSDPVTSAVEAPWTKQPSVYGPFATAVQALTSLLGGDSLRLTVWWWQLVVVAAWLGVRLLLRAVLGPQLHERVDLLWTLNPLLWSVGVLGAHVDLLATALAVAAVAAATRLRGRLGVLLAGALIGLAGSTKFTYAVVGVGIAFAFGWRTGAGEGEGEDAAPLPVRAARLLRHGILLLAGVVLVALPLHLWSGPHTYDQLLRSRRSVSLATPWRLVLDSSRDLLGSGAARTLITIGAALLAVLFLVAWLRLSRPQEQTPAAVALWLTGGLSFAYALAAPYALPWYDLLVWAALPAVAGSVVAWVAGGHLLVMACAYVPGRVLGMTPQVESATLGFRRLVAPWLVLALWAIWLRAGVRAGSARRRGSRR